MKLLGRNQLQVWIVVLGVFCLTVGCSEKKGAKPKQTEAAKQVSKKTSVEQSSKSSTMKPASDSPANETESAQPIKVVHSPEPTPTAATETTPARQPSPEEAKEAERQEKEDLIYATIRVKMEEMIQQRKDLFAAGKPPHDEEIRRLEGSIMRARDLLIEHGEEVEDVDPPIVQTGSR